MDGSPASVDAPRWAARQADLTDGHPAEVLLAAAHGADLLVVGSCALAGRLLGSVSELVAARFSVNADQPNGRFRMPDHDDLAEPPSVSTSRSSTSICAQT